MHYWMVRAGRGGSYFNEFVQHDIIAIGWDKIKDLKQFKNKSELANAYKKVYPHEPNATGSVAVGQVWGFFNEMAKGDIVLTPNPLTRSVLIGKIKGDYKYESKLLGEMNCNHRRKVAWEKEVSRDEFSLDLKHCLGSLLTVISLDKHSEEIDNVLFGKGTGVSAKGRIRFPLKSKEEAALGEPIDFEGLTNAPMEENGVIFLFGKLHERMGIRIKAIRKRFPDAVGEVWIKDRLYPRMIEFEYRSSDFKRHGHAAEKCDIIVCWKHDWRECPQHIFVIELKTEIENYIREQ